MQQTKSLMNFFKGIDEKEVLKLFSIANIIKLQAGDPLPKHDNGRSFWMVLNGDIAFYSHIHGIDYHLGTLKAGKCLDTMTSEMKGLAKSDASIMLLSEESLHSLSKEAILFFYKNVINLTSDGFSKIAVKAKDILALNKSLEDQIFKIRSDTGIDWAHSELIKSIIQKIPKLPVGVTQLTSKLLDDKISVQEAADLVKRDPALVGIILKRINSAYYHFQNKIADINYAIVYMGFDAVYQLVMAECVRKTQPVTVKAQELYFHSVAVSHLAYELSRITGKGKPSEICTIALLHELGQNVIILLKEKNPKLTQLIDLINHEQMGAMLMREWGLPEVICNSIAFQSWPEFAPPDRIAPDFRIDVALLHFANLFYRLMTGEQEKSLPLVYAKQYKPLIGLKADTPLSAILAKVLLPALIHKKEMYPESFRKLIEKHT